MSEIITVGDLTVAHVGREVTIDDGGARVSGRLANLRVNQDWIVEKPRGRRIVEPIPGRRSVTISVGRWVVTDLPLSSRVEVHP